MNRYLRFPVVLAALTLFLSVSPLQAIEKTVNPHFTKGACEACHEGKPAKKSNLKFQGDFIEICNYCHAEISNDKYIHATGMIPSPTMMSYMSVDFKKALVRNKENKLTCAVCHDIYIQCQPDNPVKAENPRFFRSGPYHLRTDICEKCHDLSNIKQRFNPHIQKDSTGEANLEICEYCHKVTPDRNKVKSIADVVFQVPDHLERLCTRCHRTPSVLMGCISTVQNNVSHLVKPSQATLDRMQKNAVAKEMILPVEPGTNMIFCGTCHNPHDANIQKTKHANKGSGHVIKLRTDGKMECDLCHKDKVR